MTHTVRRKNEEKTPRVFLEKIVIDAGIGRLGGQANFEEKILPKVKSDLAALAGQTPQIRRAKTSIAGFKMREGQSVGLRVTLRGKKMVDFFTRLSMIVLPRVRDFKGLSLRSIDRAGVLNIGIREHTVFPEIDLDHSPTVFSLGIAIVPRTKKRENAIEDYRAFGMPLKKL